jgi:hypothetical protein
MRSEALVIARPSSLRSRASWAERAFAQTI